MRRANGNLDIFCGALTKEHVVLAASIGNDILVHLIASDANAARCDNTAKARHCNFCGATTDVNDHAAGWLSNGEPCPDRGGHRLFNEADPSRPRLQRRVAHGALLHFRHAGWDADDHAWSRGKPAA